MRCTTHRNNRTATFISPLLQVIYDSGSPPSLRTIASTVQYIFISGSSDKCRKSEESISSIITANSICCC